MASNSQKSKKLLFSNLSPNMTKDELGVLIDEIDGVEGNLISLAIVSVDETNMAVVTFDSIITAENVLEILNGSPLGPNFSPIEVQFDRAGVDSLEKQPIISQKDHPTVNKRDKVSGIGRSNDEEMLSGKTTDAHQRTPATSGPGPPTPGKSLLLLEDADVNRHHQKSKKHQFVDIAGTKEDGSQSVAKANESQNIRKEKDKTKSESSGSSVLKVRKIDNAVDSDTFDRYLKMKMLKFVAFDFSTSDDDDTNEATVYFTCEEELLSAYDSLQKQCAIGVDGSEAEVDIERLDQPYPSNPDVITEDQNSKEQHFDDKSTTEENAQHVTAKATDSSGSIVLKVKNISNAVDSDTFHRYLKMRHIRFVSIDFPTSDDDEDSHEATVCFSCEKDAILAYVSLQKQCVIGDDGAEAQVTIKRVQQPYQVDPAQKFNWPPSEDVQPKLNLEQERKGQPCGRKQKSTAKVQSPRDHPGTPHINHHYPIQQPPSNQPFMYQMPPPHMPKQPPYSYPNISPGYQRKDMQSPTHGYDSPHHCLPGGFQAQVGPPQPPGGFQGQVGPPQPQGRYQDQVGPPQPPGGFQAQVGPPQPPGGFQAQVGPPQPPGGFQAQVVPPQPPGGFQTQVDRPQPQGRHQAQVSPPQPPGGFQAQVGPPQPSGRYQAQVGPPQPPGGFQAQVGPPQPPGGFQAQVGPPQPPGGFQAQVVPPQPPGRYQAQVGPPQPPGGFQAKVGPPQPPGVFQAQFGPPQPPGRYQAQVGPPQPPGGFQAQAGPPQPPGGFQAQVGPPQPPGRYQAQVGPPQPPGGFQAKGGPPQPPGGFQAQVGPPQPPGGFQAKVGPPQPPGGFQAQVGPPQPPGRYQAQVGPPQPSGGYQAQVGPPQPPGRYQAQVGPPQTPSGFQAQAGPPQQSYRQSQQHPNNFRVPSLDRDCSARPPLNPNHVGPPPPSHNNTELLEKNNISTPRYHGQGYGMQQQPQMYPAPPTQNIHPTQQNEQTLMRPPQADQQQRIPSASSATHPSTNKAPQVYQEMNKRTNESDMSRKVSKSNKPVNKTQQPLTTPQLKTRNAESTDQDDYESKPKQKSKQRQRPSNCHQSAKPSGAKPKHTHDALSFMETESTADKMSRMFDHVPPDDNNQPFEECAPGTFDEEMYSDDNDSVLSDLSSASQTRSQSGSCPKSTATSKSLLVTGFDRSTTKSSFEAFIRSRKVKFINMEFRGASREGGPSAVVRFSNTRETTNGKKALHGVIMHTANGGGSMIQVVYIWPQEPRNQARRGRGPMKARARNDKPRLHPDDSKSDIGSTVSSRSKSNQQQLSTVLKITGAPHGVDAALVSKFCQEKSIPVKRYEFETGENQNMCALLHFDTPKACGNARSKLHGQYLAVGGNNVKAFYVKFPSTSDVPETTQGGVATHGDTGVVKGNNIRGRRSGRSGSLSSQPAHHTKYDDPPRLTSTSGGSDKQQCCLKVTAIDESVDEEAFRRFLRRKRVRFNNFQWFVSNKPSLSNRADLHFASQDEAMAAKKLIDGSLLGEIAMKAELSSPSTTRKPKRTRRKGPKQTEVDYDDASSDVSSVASFKSSAINDRRQRELRLQERLATSVRVTNIDPGVDEDDFREFLLNKLEDFTELQFVSGARGSVAIVGFDTPYEAKEAKEMIHGKKLEKGKKYLRAFFSGGSASVEKAEAAIASTVASNTISEEAIERGNRKTNPAELRQKQSRPKHMDRSSPPQLSGNPNDVIIEDIPQFVRESDMATIISETNCKGFVNITVIQDETASSKRSAILTFDSRVNAVEATAALYGKRLKGFCMNVRLAQEHSGLGNMIAKKKIQALLNDIEAEGNKVVSLLESRMNDLALQIREIEEKLQGCDSITEAIVLEQQKETVEQQIGEIQGYQVEFEQVSSITKTRLDQLQPLSTDKVDMTELDNLRQRFLRECRRIHRPLPIYGHKSFIMETITASDTNACVIRAETGSGKSTQVPQYLIEDSTFLGRSNGSKRSVVCTQPRRVAAISLARRVSEEYGCKVGEEVGYVAGQSRKRSSRTLLTFMTDRALLNLCLADKSDLDNYACVIIDEAHERSVDTDILLAMLKKIQQRRSDLKIVIMSATIDVDLFSKYLYNCPVISVPGRTFPVDTIWCGSVDSTGFGDYMNKAVQKTVEIHKQEAIAGDILVFLTSQNEIERACNELASALKIANWQETQNENAIILPLHGKLQPDDQMKVFKDTPHGKRKIVFATNVAETSVTIPGIKYVVDTGMVKECQYDPQRNMSLLKVTSITQASAEQRKGRAGRTDPGKCYRLYSRTDYDGMEQSMKPEIMRVHLGMAMLQLIQMGVQDVENFDFVESPGKDAIQQAMESLILLGGVDNGRQLTLLGTKMAQLPLEPRLAKLVLTGIGNNLGDEAIVIAALISAPGNIIYRGSSEAEQKTSEMMKLNYSSEGGDILTMLKIYQKWRTIPEKSRNTWCKHNSMNAKTLRSVKENVEEIKQILKRTLQLVVEESDQPTEESTYDMLIRKILMSVYFENLSVYNGHARAGYTILAQQKTAAIHPSSVLKSLQSPKWLIYGDLRRTAKDFICDLTPVDEEWIDEVVPPLFRDKIDREALERNIIKELKIEKVGTALMKTLAMKRFEKLRSIEDDITKETNTPCIIEANWESGTLNVFIAGCGEAHAREKIKRYIEDEKTRAGREQIEVPVGSYGSVRHVVVTGCETGIVLMGDEYRSLDISNVSSYASQEEMLQLCGCKHDQVKEIFKFPSHWSQAKKGVWGRVTFLNPSDAVQVKTTLEKTVYPGEEEAISAQPSLPKQNTVGPRRKPAIETTVEVTWFLTRSKGFGFVSCDTTADSLTLMDNVRGLPLRGKPICCDLKREDSRVVFISKLDYHVTPEELESALKRATRVAFNSVSIVRNSPTTDMKNSTAEKHLRRLFNIEGIGHLDINVLDPRSEKSQRRKAFVNFDPSFLHEMSEKVEKLQTTPAYTDTQEIYHVRMLVTSNLFCLKRIFVLLRDPIDEFIDAAESSSEGITVKVMQLRNRSDRRLQISGSDYQKVFDIRTAIKALLDGDEVPIEEFVGEGKPLQWVQRSLHILSQNRVQEILGDTTAAFIDIDMRRHVIHIYGKKEDREKVRRSLHDFFLSLTTETKTKEMRGIKGRILRALVLQFGPYLEQLKEEPGVEDITIDTKRGVLMITGSEDAQDGIVEKIQTCMKGINMVEDVPEEIECGICFCPADPGEKTYRLLSCGHFFCLKCLEDLLQHNITDKTFPVICPCEDCTEPLMLVDIRTVFPEEEKHTALFRAALEAFVTQKSQQNGLKFCPSPDCCMIYLKSKDGAPWTCTECGHQICTGCGEDPHPGNMTCEAYRVSKMREQNSDSVLEWVRTSGANVKQCPTPDCGFIEKYAGCNHMCCIKCRKHICWKCLDSFSTSTECYAHLSAKHGGY